MGNPKNDTVLIAFRCEKELNDIIESYMERRGCDKSTALREILRFFIDMGGIDLLVTTC